MGPVNWIAVVSAAMVALVIGVVWYGARFRFIHPAVRAEPKQRDRLVFSGIAALLGSAMLGHNYARIGAETLAAKPWLYFMQSGGLALFFVIPAVWMTCYRLGAAKRVQMGECVFYLIAYLSMGAVFWALG